MHRKATDRINGVGLNPARRREQECEREPLRIEP
jgi:hypothetical protein